MRLNSGNGTVMQIGRRTKKQDDRILVLRSIAGFLVVPGLAANIFVWSFYSFPLLYTYDNDLMSWAFALSFALSIWTYIIIFLFGLPWHVYFIESTKATLKNYIILWTSIGISISIIWIVTIFKGCYYSITCSTADLDVAFTFVTFVPALQFVLIGCLSGLIFWLIVCWRHDFHVSDRAP